MTTKTTTQELEDAKRELKNYDESFTAILRALSATRHFDPNGAWYKLVLELVVGAERFEAWRKENLVASVMAERIKLHVAAPQLMAERMLAEREKPHYLGSEKEASIPPLSVGRIVHYFAGPEASPLPAVVIAVEKDPWKLNGSVFSLLDAGLIAVQNVPHWSAAGSGGCRWAWPKRE